MKKILIVLLLSLISAHAGESVTLNLRDKAGIRKTIQDSAVMFVNEIEPFLRKPMDWCSLKPTGESEVYRTDKEDVVELVVTAELSCNETKAYQYYKSIVNRYLKFILKNEYTINSIVKERYPDLMFSGIMMNHTVSVKVQYNTQHGSNASRFYHNKTRFFRMVLNDEFVSSDVKKFHLEGSLITTHHYPLPILKKKQKFTFRVYKKTLAKNTTIRFDPIYHPTEEEARIAQAK